MLLDGGELVRLSWCKESSTDLTSRLPFIMVNHLVTELGALPCSISYSQSGMTASVPHTIVNKSPARKVVGWLQDGLQVGD